MSAAEYLPPDEMTLDAAGQALARHLEVRDGLVRETERTYYDTFDGLLHGAGLSLSFEGGDLMLSERETGLMRARLAMSQPAKPLFASELEPGPLRDALRPIIGVRALLALVHLRTRERVLDLLDDERKTVVRMALEEPVLVRMAPEEPVLVRMAPEEPALVRVALEERALVKSTPSPTALRPRVRVAAVRGYDEALDHVRGALEDELGFKLVDQPLVDEAVRAAGAAPGGISSKLDVPLDYEQRSDSAAVAVLARLLEVIEANLEGTIADVDSEFLHDLRVSVRRSRAVQRELAGVFPPRQVASFRGEFRWLQQISGDSRDLDVYVLEFDDYRAMVPEEMRPDLDPLREVLSSRRLAAHAELARELRSARATSLRSDWSSFLGVLEGLANDDRPDAARPIGELVGERVRKVYRRMVRMGDAIGESSPADDYHELRKKGKELRYLLELFGVSLYPGEVVKPMIKALKALQDVLGRHQDREVQVAMLHSLREKVAAMPEGPAALMAMGALVQRLGEDQLAARGAFAEPFAEFASKAQRKLVKDTFA